MGCDGGAVEGQEQQLDPRVPPPGVRLSRSFSSAALPPTTTLRSYSALACLDSPRQPLLQPHAPPVRPLPDPELLLTPPNSSPRTVGIVLGKISVEVPVHTVLFHSDQYEVRQYAPQVIATYTATSKNGSDGFRALAGYCGIFSKPKQVRSVCPCRLVRMLKREQVEDDKKKAMAMTAPVLMEGMKELASGGRDVNSMSFFLPSSVKTVDDAPKPTDPQIVVSQLPERTLAVLTFSGNISATVFEDKVALLKEFLEKDGVVVKKERALFAGYNPPFCVPWLKTNEVLIAVDPATVAGQATRDGANETAAQAPCAL